MSTNTSPLLLFGLPTNGEHSFLFTQSLLGMQWPTNFSMNFRAVPGYEVGDARNLLVQEAIDTGARYLLFIDEDVIVPGDAIRRLIYQLEQHPDWTVCGGVYASKTIPPEPLVFTEWGMGPSWGWKIGELIKVKFSGCGCHLFRVSDLKAMKGPTNYVLRDPWTGEPRKLRQWFKTGREYFVTPEGINAFTGHTEDSWFYSMCEEEGLQVYLDSSILCKHYEKKSGLFFEVPTESLVAVKPDAWNHSPRTANLGAGRAFDPYAVNVDLRDGPGIFKCDIRKLPKDWEGQFDAARAEHVLEHFPYWQAPEILTEWIRILKPGGLLQIEVPNVEFAFEQLKAGFEDPRILGSIYGDQGAPYWNEPAYGGYDEGGRFLPHSHEHNSHKAGYTRASLAKLFQSLGLKNIQGEIRDGWYLYMQGEKPAVPQVVETTVLASAPTDAEEATSCQELS